MDARQRIAVIDDDSVIRDLLLMALDDEGYQGVVWTDEHDPIAFIHARRPDLVIIDLRLGGNEHGSRIIEALRQDAGYPSLPIIVLSADAQALAESEQRFAELNVTSIPKPFDLETLLGLIACLLRSQ